MVASARLPTEAAVVAAWHLATAARALAGLLATAAPVRALAGLPATQV